jgi:hypothetical protein
VSKASEKFLVFSNNSLTFVFIFAQHFSIGERNLPLNKPEIMLCLANLFPDISPIIFFP